MRTWSGRVLVTSLLGTVLLAGCGSSGQADVRPAVGAGEDGPTSSAGSASASPSGAASATPRDGQATIARSDLEGQAPVKAVRLWAAAVAREVNAKSSSHAPTRQLTTARGGRRLPPLYAEDYGLTYPGPLPFTPLSVRVSGRTARVPSCVQATGWAINGSGISPQRKVVTASTFVLKRVSGSWRLDRINGRQGSCADVSVKGYAS